MAASISKLSLQQEADLKQYNDLSMQYKELRSDTSEAGRQARAMVAQKLNNTPHDVIHPNEERLIVDVPQAPDGSIFTINETPYHGEVTVPACIASHLLYMIDMSRRVDNKRMSDQGSNFPVTAIGQIAARINAEP